MLPEQTTEFIDALARAQALHQQQNQQELLEIKAQAIAKADWEAQYEFWTKIISDEVARKRFNEGFEPIDCDLYELKDNRGALRKLVGRVRICGRDFQVSVSPSHEHQGQPNFKLQIRVAARQHP